MRERLARIANNYWVNLGALLALVLAITGWPVPSGSEYVYLVDAARFANADFLQGDWTYESPWYSHLVFSLSIFPLLKLFSLETATWIGRMVCWLLGLAGLLRLGGHFRLPPWAVSLAIGLWLVAGQSVVGKELAITTLEAKVVAWALLFFALDAFLRERELRGAVLLGLSINFHILVGMWGALGVGVALIALRVPFGRLARVVGVTALVSLPGLALALAVALHSNRSYEDLLFYSQVLFPGHLDPTFWPRRDLLLLPLLFLVHVLHARANWNDRALRFCLWFQCGVGLVFLLGIASHFAENFAFLQMMPFRLFPVFVLLLFLLSLFHAFYHGAAGQQKLAMGLIVLLALPALGNPLGAKMDRLAQTRSMWAAQEDDLTRVFRWIAGNTPEGAVVISPPWRMDAFFLSRRPQVVSLNAIDIRRFDQWRARMNLLVGGPWQRTPEDPWGIASMKQAYLSLSHEQILEISRTIGGDYLISQGDYEFKILFTSGDWHVFQLPPPGPDKADPATDGDESFARARRDERNSHLFGWPGSCGERIADRCGSDGD